MIHLYVVGVLIKVGDDTVFIRNGGIEKIIDFLAAAADVEIEILVNREILE